MGDPAPARTGAVDGERGGDSGASALEELGRSTFAAIFLDVKLPDTDGFELAGTIKRIAPATPIVMISAYFYPARSQGSTDAGGRNRAALHR